MPRSLLGKTVLVTRPRDQAQELQIWLEARGADAPVQPAIEILPPENWNDVDDVLRQISKNKFGWALFSSANGVRFVCDRAASVLSGGARCLGAHINIAAVGPGTANVLNEYGLKAAIVPEQFDADGLADAFVERYGNLFGRSFVSFRASRGRKTLSERLTALGARVRETVAYRNVDVTTADLEILAALQSDKIDFTTVTSSASARALAQMFGDGVKKTRWIAISPLTADALRQEGIDVDAVAEEATMPSLVDAVVQAAR